MVHLKEKVCSLGMTTERWQTYCEEVAAAAEQLRQLASRAASDAALCNDPIEELARSSGLLGPGPSAKADTYATMMLGPFAALEALRQQLTPP